MLYQCKYNFLYSHAFKHVSCMWYLSDNVVINYNPIPIRLSKKGNQVSFNSGPILLCLSKHQMPTV